MRTAREAGCQPKRKRPDDNIRRARGSHRMTEHQRPRREPAALPAIVALLAAACWSAVLAAEPSTAVPGNYAERPEVRAFVDEMASEHGFDARSLRRLFAQVRYQPQVIAAISRPVALAAQVVRVRAAIPRAGARGRGRGILARPRGRARACRGGFRRPARDHRRHHRRGNLLRALPRAATASSTR